MVQVAGRNPWLSMWSQPTVTIRAILHSNSKYGIYALSSLYAFENFLFFSNWWSFGLNTPYYTILILSILLSPIVGIAWLYYTSWIFQLTGKLFKGQSSAAHLRTAIAWSKIPSSVSVFMWLILLANHPNDVFIHASTGPSSIFINFITFIVAIWSYILLVQALRETQKFSLLAAVGNFVLAWLLSSLILLLIFNIVHPIILIYL